MDKSQRRTDEWFENRVILTNGPGHYESIKLKAKESFNYGHIPFGSKTSRFNILAANDHTFINPSISLNVPGPGSY
jgi:hypothetical protein